MAIASNIFKQLLYVPEGSTLGVVDADSTTTQFSSTVTVDSSTYKIGDDEVGVTFTGTGTTKLNKGTRIVFSNSTQEYYLTADVNTASGQSSGTLILDRPLVAIPAASSTVTQSYTSPYKQNRPKLLRRVSSNLEAKFETYSSNEIRADQQLADYRIGAKTVDGTLSCELSSRTYEDFFAALLRKNFYSPVQQNGTGSAVAVTLGTNLVIGVNDTNVAKLTFAVGDVGSQGSEDAGTLATHLFTGLRVGDIVVINPSTTTGLTATVNGATTLAAWNLVPFLILDKDTTNRVITIVAAAEPSTCAFGAGNIPAGVKFQVLGRKSFVPLTGHLKKSFQFEHFFADLSATATKPVADLFTGCRVTQGAVKLPTSGIATVDFTIMGTGTKTPDDTIALWDGGGNANFAAAPTKSMMETLSGDVPQNPAIDAVYSSAVGNVYFKDKKTGGQLYKADAITSFDFSINANGSTLKVIGSTTSPDVAVSKLQVTGNMSVYFKDNTLRTSFVNSEDMSFIATFAEGTSNSTSNAFMNFVFPRVKLGGVSKDDAESIVMTVPFQALVGDGTTGYEATTISIQDYSQLA